ncbi:MAG: VWA domain-containing protein [Blastocatellia bacterium]|nr:VWA domain-containing protein [Blastocatellia bacterium]
MFSGFQFRYPYYLLLLTTLIPLAALLYWLIERRKRQLVEFFGKKVEKQASQINRYYLLRGLIILAATALCITALARPQWGETQELVKTKGIDVIIAVDVSLSMLADDEYPSRLERAKRLAIDLLSNLSNNRVGLIGFAGSSTAVMPLTVDTAALESFLDDLDVRTADLPGTAIAQTIERATRSFQSVGRQSRLLIIISDGEEQSEQPVAEVAEAAEQAAEQGVTIVTLGIGTEQGSNIPLDAIGAIGLKQDADGNIVTTKLDETVLRTAAELTQGLYLKADPEGEEVAEVVKFLDKLRKGELQTKLVKDRQERYQYPILIATLLILFESFILVNKKLRSI